MVTQKRLRRAVRVVSGLHKCSTLNDGLVQARFPGRRIASFTEFVDEQSGVPGSPDSRQRRAASTFCARNMPSAEASGR